MTGAAVSWVLRVVADDRSSSWWCGPGQLSSPFLIDALSFDTPHECRAAMRAVGWAPCGPGFITPMRLALVHAADSQLALFAM